MLDAFGDLGAAQEEAAHLEVFLDGQILEHASAFRRDGDAAAHDVVGGHLGDVFALEHDLAAACARVAADGHQERGLARAVAANQGDDFALVDVQAHLVDRADRAVVGGDALQLQHVFGAHLMPLPDRP
ncbi:hypothetical protein SDC9_143634 [bioreactor metagenome]|uniref:Uncharacterized protein n=1 Tax=bioreactor metagenome TaxID=1076179 RepID=A0A645E4G9_9ZZZZ